MTAIVSIETVLLVLLVVLVAGLLRSHAEILRRLGPAEGADGALAQPSQASRATGAEVSAPVLSGTTPAGDAVSLSFEGNTGSPTLLAFLTSGCSTCAGFWESLAEPRLPGVQTVIVAHGTDRERPGRIRSLAPDAVPVVMSSQAWKDYRVPGAPYFVLIDGHIRGEGVATTWQGVASLVGDAIEEQHDVESAVNADARAHPGARARRVEETLAAAGIGPDHPSLYPGGQPEQR
jgi:hypothetical protein